MSSFVRIRATQSFALVAVTSAFLALSGSAAYAVPYSTGGLFVDKLGLEANYVSDYDKLTLAAYNNDAVGTVLLNPATFDVGYNATIPAPHMGTLSETVTIDGIQNTISIPYTIDIAYSDTLHLIGGAVYWFGAWKLTLSDLFTGAQPIGSQSYDYEGTISPVPLPASLPLFAAALAGLAVLARLRGRKGKRNGANSSGLRPQWSLCGLVPRIIGMAAVRIIRPRRAWGLTVLTLDYPARVWTRSYLV